MPIPEALLITNTTLSITVKAFTTCQQAYSLVRGIKDAPKHIQRLSTDILGLYQVLGLLQTALTNDNGQNAQLPRQMVQDLEALLDTCTQLSIDVMTVVNPLLTAGGEVKGGIWKSISWELFKKNDLVNLQQTLATCKLTINMAISALNFVTGNQTNTALEQIQKEVAQIRDVQERQANVEQAESISSTEAVCRFSVASYNLPLRRFLEETESLLDPDASSLSDTSFRPSGGSPIDTGLPDNSWQQFDGISQKRTPFNHHDGWSNRYVQYIAACSPSQINFQSARSISGTMSSQQSRGPVESANKLPCTEPSCSASFTREDDLRRHFEFKHSGTFTYHCPFSTCSLDCPTPCQDPQHHCTFTQPRIDKMKRHFEEVHPSTASGDFGESLSWFYSKTRDMISLRCVTCGESLGNREASSKAIVEPPSFCEVCFCIDSLEDLLSSDENLFAPN
ncbi:uncharacterized protein LY89DRAFT_734995 [Mollisia scopiformis]|uniref:C2H2-type domain-containing protein n=1 Tax=Mollisia scopiformis TaxID=149040 RepID=A0A194X6Y6_MOLSC|nr:uncharacterized protein LY89DRAFT_734995 [Mollisia scopiformis]KUJ15849.1 hypothetical protein LY89DRAFT_734995 [Mollisia scopiformis]